MQNAITVLTDHPWQEYLFWWAQSLLLIAVVAGAWIAFVQLRVVANQARATLLLELDRRFESDEMAEARSKLRQIRDEAMACARAANRRVNDGALLELMKPECARIVGQLRNGNKANKATYAKLLSFLGFFETVGSMVARQYVTADEINRLLRASILDLDLYFGVHITERRQEPGAAADLFEETLELIKTIRALPPSVRAAQ